MKRKTAGEKKEADYKWQRRTHWDSDKGTRKAIPEAKRAARQIIRKRAAEFIDSSVAQPENAPTAAGLAEAEIEKRNRYRKYWGGEPLREHVEHQKRSRKAGQLKRVWKQES
jgi:hypothetical protein